MVKAITTTAVMAVAVSTIYGFVEQQITPTSKAKIRVKTMSIGRPNRLKKSLQHPITMDMTSNSTDRMIIEAVFPNIFLNESDFIAHTQIRAVIMSCMLKRV